MAILSIYLFFPLLILFVPIRFYKSYEAGPIRFWKRMSYTTKGSKMMAYMLIAIGAFYHIVYFEAFPRDPSIMGSTAILIAICNVEKSTQWLERIRNDRTVWKFSIPVIVATAFIRPLLPMAMILAIILECAFFLPGEKMNDFDWGSSLSTDKKLVDTYFA